MKSATCVACGVAAAFIGASAARAGSLDILYWGKDSDATLVVDGQTYNLNDEDDWVSIKNLDGGAHSMTLYANGATLSRDFTLTDDNADTTGGKDGSTWCVDLEDNGMDLLDTEDCDDMMAAYFGD